jgi:16S rRNA (guanine966-N2)-methyltransferase
VKPGIRITGGRLRGRKVQAPPGLEPTRPSPGIVREALFSILGQELTVGGFCDLYAGTGSVAIEAISRGAPRATAVENHRAALDCLRKSSAELGLEACLEIVSYDAARFNRPGVFHIVFADPPFGAIPSNLMERCLDLCRPGGWAVLQWPSDRPKEWPDDHQVRKYGSSLLVIHRKPA